MPIDADGLVREFCAAWERLDPDEIAAYFTPDAIYHNIPMQPIVGRDAIRQLLASFKTAIVSIRFEVLRQVSTGGIVMNERVDYINNGSRTIALPVMGVFEVSEGQIKAWRDYFDLGQYTNG